jgi:hypothetical protein
MGYRLNVMIPNDEKYSQWIELGKQYHDTWYDFNNNHFGENKDDGLFHYDYIKDFYNDLLETNNKVSKVSEDYKLYNLDILKDIVYYAVENKKYVYFMSF